MIQTEKNTTLPAMPALLVPENGQVIDKLDPLHYIIIKGGRVNNLKNINVAIPRNKFIVITGLSGSGKSSLAFDTLYAEGQRRYVESLSSYARQFLGRLNKPDVDYIKGISPAIAIEQRTASKNPRSTVGTSTEIYDYMKLLFARAGRTFSPVSGNEVKRNTISDVVDYVRLLPKGTKIILCSPVKSHDEMDYIKRLNMLLLQGFSRIITDGEIQNIENILSKKTRTHDSKNNTIGVVIDRVAASDDEETLNRIADSANTAFFEGNGECNILINYEPLQETITFSNRFESDNITFEEPSVNFFSFNNPYGACKTCEGFGSIIGIDEDMVIPDKSLSVYEDAIMCWRGEKMSAWKDRLIMNADKFNFPVHRSFYDLTNEQKKVLWKGNQFFKGLDAFFEHLEEKSYKIQYRVMLSRYRGKTLCSDCNGTRLRKDASYVKIGNKTIIDIVQMPINMALNFFKTLKLSEHEAKIAKRLLVEIINRLQVLCEVGLGYLTLNRLYSTLSGGESQRISLATSLGSNLTGSMYILDEPSIGLHPRDTQRLISVLKSLKQLGNTVIVVEHEEEIMRAADHIIDIGPLAGRLGGHIVFQGNLNEAAALLKSNKNTESYTIKYLLGHERIDVPTERKLWKHFIHVKGARENNLKSIDVKFPLNIMVVVTGVSGSGKTSLVNDVLYGSLRKRYGGYAERTGKYDKIEGDIDKISNIEMIDQNPIGKSSRSNPVTYIKAYDELRELFSEQALSKQRGYKPRHFSFNVVGGRCEECEGEGKIKIEMQFMADLYLVCESCKGKRFKEEVLEIKYSDMAIDDMLRMTVNEAIEFTTANHNDSVKSKSNSLLKHFGDKLQPLQDVGLGYVQLGQSSSTLSGGEAQRIKLASFLANKSSESKTLFIFDEPTTGLHFHDIRKLLKSLNALVDYGNSVIIIEHNPEIIVNADWVIDMGYEGGDAGGNIVFEGTPEDLVKCEKSYTGQFLKNRWKL